MNRVKSPMTLLHRSLALALSSLVVLAPVARAQDDDDMPDGDVDIQEEKKKPKKQPKREPPKKAEQKAEPPPKKEPAPKKEPKRAPGDDDDILTGDDAPAPKVAPKTTPAVSTNDLLVDDDDDMPATPPPKAEPKPAPKVITLPARTLDDEPPVRTVVDPARNPDPEPGDDIPEAPVRPARSLDEPAPADDESEGPPTGLIVGGAIGGAVLVLAGAGVGGYFLFNSLQNAGSTTVTIVPR